MYILALFVAYWSKNNLLLSHLRNLPTHIENMLETCQGDINNKVNRFRYMKVGFVLSRGICYPIALEAALKIQETCYIKMKGYSIADFYHGPFAQLDSNVPVIIFAPIGKALNDIDVMINRLNELNIQPLIITNDEWMSKSSYNSILLPDTGFELTQAFIFGIFAQLFAERLSVSMALNPDQPSTLSTLKLRIKTL
jgi:glucosamine--fructose-6-phosphate aminotransferase (isomerizing)